MKKEVTKHECYIEDISMEKAVSDFFDEEEWYLNDWEDTEWYVDSYIEDLQEISDEEKDQLKAEIKKKFDKKADELRQIEIEKLKDRRSILYFIDNHALYNRDDEGEVGYLLSSEEVLDLIIQNGNK